VGDLVVATVHHSSTDAYHARLSDYTAFATLPQLAFEAATKKTRPQLTPGTLVYARIALADRYMDPELECVSAATGKADGLGPLVGGMLFDISLAMSRRLMMSRPAEQGAVVLLDELGALGVAFEIAVGRNGKLWVNSKTVKATIAIGKAVQEIDSRRLGVEEQKKMARKLAREL
jgi:exosome complex component RRP40